MGKAQDIEQLEFIIDINYLKKTRRTDLYMMKPLNPLSEIFRLFIKL